MVICFRCGVALVPHHDIPFWQHQNNADHQPYPINESLLRKSKASMEDRRIRAIVAALKKKKGRHAEEC